MPYWRLSGVYFTYFAVVGALAPFWGLYLQSLGFNAHSIGIISAIPLVTKLGAPNLWGWLADCTGKQLLIIRLGALGAALFFVGVMLNQSFWLLVTYIA
ncbi:MAG: PPP family 3-phenylpropionic acid transporter, partial [Lentisphaeria bacterium]